MSIYTPIGGHAGKIKATLCRRTGQPVGQELEMYVFGFSESLEPADGNDVFENILNDLVENYYGERKVITFDVANGGGLGYENLRNIVLLSGYIDIIRREPQDYKLQIVFRSDRGIEGRIDDAVFFGDLSPKEISNSSSTGQTISMQFKSRTAQDGVVLDFYDPLNQLSGLLLNENPGFGFIALEDGGALMLETINIIPNVE